VDDDPDILQILKDNLELDGFTVAAAATGKEALQWFQGNPAALIVLDLSLPDIDGIQVCRLIREKSEVPIIMLTATDSVPDKVLGLESGADDYVVKPFDYLELSARVRACLRRRRPAGGYADILRVDPFEMDPTNKTVLKRGEAVSLTRSEFNLLLLLARNAGRALSRTAIRHELWPERELYGDSRTIDVHIQHLRSKLEDDPGDPKYIITVQGVGYMMGAGPATG